MNWQQKDIQRKEMICEVCEQSFVQPSQRLLTVADYWVLQHLGRKIFSYLCKPCLRSLYKHKCKVCRRSQEFGVKFLHNGLPTSLQNLTISKHVREKILSCIQTKTSQIQSVLWTSRSMSCANYYFYLSIYIGL